MSGARDELSESTNSLAFRLRPASAGDESTIKSMVRGAHLNPFGLKWQRFTLAVTERDEIVGCIQLKPHRGGAFELASLVVVKGWRRKGVAGRLIEYLKETAGPPLWLMCGSRLTKFYEPFSFRQVHLGQPMPGYFRWMLRLAFILNRFGQGGQTLTIMVWHGANQIDEAS